MIKKIKWYKFRFWIQRFKWSIYFFKWYKFRWIPNLYTSKLRWKDKWDSPRCEEPPGFMFTWLRFGISGQISSDRYWEQYLWIKYWNKGDYDEAKANWGWTDMNTGKSSWIDY